MAAKKTEDVVNYFSEIDYEKLVLQQTEKPNGPSHKIRYNGARLYLQIDRVDVVGIDKFNNNKLMIKLDKETLETLNEFNNTLINDFQIENFLKENNFYDLKLTLNKSDVEFFETNKYIDLKVIISPTVWTFNDKRYINFRLSKYKEISKLSTLEFK